MTNPKGSVWRSPSNKLRKRKRFEVTLSEEAIAALDDLALRFGSRSGAVEAGIWLLQEKDSKRKPTGA